MPLIDGVRRTIRRHDLARPSTRVGVAVSGGADSVALLYLLAELRDAGDLRLAGIVHFNHQLRPVADDDERFCAELAAALSLPFVSDRADVAAAARQQRRSLEDTARTERHAFFRRAAAALAADAVALGHTRDDQAETVLLRLLRGAGTRGLGGMHPRRGLAIRPLLDTTRAQLRDYLTARAIPYRDDETNLDVSIPRNRVRHELLPLLAQRFNPSIARTLASEAELFRAQEAFLDHEAGEWMARHCPRGEEGRLPVAALLSAPLALSRAVLHRGLRAAAGARTISFRDVERALAVAAGRIGGYDGPGLRVERIAGDLVLRGRPGGARGRRPRATQPNLFEYPLSIPGEVQIVETEVLVSAEVAEGWSGAAGPAMATVQMPAGGGLTVRNRRPGDRFQPLGAPGRKKLQDFFIDRKVGRGERDTVPLVVDSADRIIWVAGHAIDEAFRVRDPAQSVIILRLKGVGGSV
jgi:tRNA(Ile)-lysidine synthase